MPNNFFPENMYPVQGIAPISDTGALNSDIINCANAACVWIFVHRIVASAATNAYSFYQGTDVSTCATAFVTTLPIWYCNSLTTSSQWIRKTAAVTYTMPADATSQMLLVQVNADAFSDGYSTLKFSAAGSGQANLTAVSFWIQPRYSSKVATFPATAFIA